MEFRLQSFRRKKRGQCYLVAVWRRLLGKEDGGSCWSGGRVQTDDDKHLNVGGDRINEQEGLT